MQPYCSINVYYYLYNCSIEVIQILQRETHKKRYSFLRFCRNPVRKPSSRFFVQKGRAFSTLHHHNDDFIIIKYIIPTVTMQTMHTRHAVFTAQSFLSVKRDHSSVTTCRAVHSSRVESSSPQVPFSRACWSCVGHAALVGALVFGGV